MQRASSATDWFRSLSQKESRIYLGLLLVLVVFLAYANVYQNPFLLDDKNLIVGNHLLRHWDNMVETVLDMPGFFRPLQIFVYFLVYQAFGLSLAAFHGLNIVLHAVNALLVFWLGCKLGFKTAASFFAALVWAVHPLHTEAVAFMSGTAEPLFSMFCLAGILLLLPDFSMRKIGWAAGILLCALASKGSAAVFPGLVAGTLYLVSKDRLRISIYFRTSPLLALALIYVAGIIIFYRMNPNIVLYDHHDKVWDQFYVHSILNRILTCLAALPTYIRLLVWPTGLHMDYDLFVLTTLSWRAMAGIIVVVGAGAQIFYGRTKRLLPLSWGLIWFSVAQSPNTGILMPINAVISEHWMYLPSAGLFLGLAQTISLYLEKIKIKYLSGVACSLAVLAALLLGSKTYFQNEVWSNEITFYENVISCGSHSGRAHTILTMLYSGQGRFDEAIEHAQAAIEHPSPLYLSSQAQLHIDLALMYLHAKPEDAENGIITTDEVKRVLPFSSRIPEAIEEFEKAQQLNSNLSAGQFLEVIHDYQKQEQEKNLYKRWSVK